MLVAVRDAKSEEHEERASAIFSPAVPSFGLPTQKNMLKYAVLILWRKKTVAANCYAFFHLCAYMRIAY